ncbi:hypothetical protein ACKLNO_11310 [Neisseriaceae bacterium B1]
MNKLLSWLVGLAAIAFGVYFYINASQTDKRFESEAVAIGKAIPASSQYTETRGKFGLGKSYKTDLGFKDKSGQDIFLNNEVISEEELAALQAGKSIEREYLVAEPHVARVPGQTESKWISWLFALVGIVICLVGLGNKDEENTTEVAQNHPEETPKS